MLPAEFTYRFQRIRQTVKRLLGQLIDLFFLLASIATLILTAYEFGYPVSAKGIKYLHWGFGILLRIFLFGGLLKIMLDPRAILREKGRWIEVSVLILLAFVFLTLKTAHSGPFVHLQKTAHLLLHTLSLVASIIHLSKVVVATLQRHIRPEMMFVYSFLAFILAGAFLLMLPRAHNGKLSFIDALFTSTSAVCITGLTTVDTATTFTFTGQAILLMLIQIGGIGVMTFTSFIALSFFTHTSFNDQMALRNILSEESMNNIFRTLLYTFLTTLLVEAAGTYILWWTIKGLPDEQIPDKLFFAVFHAVSGFCNAGFSILSGNLYHPVVRNLYGFQGWLAILIILGGIGFPIVFNYGKLLNHKIRNLFYRLTGSPKRMPSHVRIVSTTTRIVITATCCLLTAGTLLFLLFEYNHLLQDLPFRDKLAVSFFGAVTPRTAGFNTVNMNLLSPATIFLTLVLMWIGASPLSTGGGIKTTTFVIAVKNIYTTLKGKEKTEIFKRHLSTENVRRAHAIIFLSLVWIATATTLLAFLMPEGEVSRILFEVVSAISTVGLSLDFTPQLNTAGKIIISLTMFAGRVGLIFILSGFVHRQGGQSYTYAEDNVIL